MFFGKDQKNQKIFFKKLLTLGTSCAIIKHNSIENAFEQEQVGVVEAGESCRVVRDRVEAIAEYILRAVYRTEVPLPSRLQREFPSQNKSVD